MSKPTFLHTTLLFLGIALLHGTSAAKPSGEVDQLMSELSSAVLRDRRSAAEKLGRTGEAARTAVPALVAALGDSDDLVRRNAAWALGKIQVPHDAVVAGLMAKLQEENEDWSVRHNVALSLSWIGEPAVPALLRGLEAKVAWTRAYSADALIRIGGEEKTKQVVPVVGQLLGSPDMNVRAFAAALTGRLGPLAEPLAGKLAGLLDEKDIHPRMNAIKALVEIGPAAHAALPRVKRALREDSDQWVRISAVQVLVAIPGNEDETIRLLINSFADEKERVGGYAVQSIVRLGKASVPQVLTALKSENPRVRLRAAETLAFMGNAAGDSSTLAASLVAVLGADGEWGVRSMAAAAIGAIGLASEDVVAALEMALRDEHEIVRLNASDALKKLGRAVPAMAPATPAGAVKTPGAGTPRQT